MKSQSALVFKLKILTAILWLALASFAQAEDLYKTIGVPNTADATQIKKAWKSLVLQFHPDRFMNDPEAAQAATEKLKVINAAENVLGNPVLRAYYDFLSNGGANYERWASVPGNTNVEAMTKRFGPPENLQSRNPFASAAQAQPKPSPSPQPTPKPTPQAEKADNFNQFLSSLGNAAFSAGQWREAYDLYLNQTPNLTDSNRQRQFLQLLKLPLENWKTDLLLNAVVIQFQSVDDSVTKTLLSIVNSEKEIYRRYGVGLLQNALAAERTSDLLKMDFASARSLLLVRMQDPLDTVRAKAVRAVSTFAFSEQKDIAASIRSMVLDKSFEVAWESQKFISEQNKLSLAENFLPFLQYLEKYQSEPLNSVFTYQRADKNDAFLSLVKFRQMSQAPVTPEIKKVLIRLLQSSNQNLANVTALTMFSKMNGEWDQDILQLIHQRSQLLSDSEKERLQQAMQAPAPVDEPHLQTHMQELLLKNSYFEKMPSLNMRVEMMNLLQIIGKSSNLAGIVSELQYLKESTSLPEVRDQVQALITKAQTPTIVRCESLFTN